MTESMGEDVCLHAHLTSNSVHGLGLVSEAEQDKGNGNGIR